MTLSRLELHNYMIHRDLTADLGGNLIALTGEMGHGKSTFVGAIQFCLTGEHPPWHREDLVTWGESEGSAKLYFTHDGVECSIIRKLTTPDVTLKIGADTITGARNVEKTMAERLGVDKDILKQIGFVQQYDIQAILFDDPAKRERAFQKLLGIGDANKIWSDLGAIIQANSKFENFDASIESLKVRITSIEDSLKNSEGMLKASEEALALVPSFDEMQGHLEWLTRNSAQITEYARAKKACADAASRLDGLTASLTELTAKYTQLKETLNYPPEEMEKFISNLRLAHGTALAELGNMRKLAGASDKDGTCPLCGSHVEAGQIAAHTASEMARLEKAEAEAKKNLVDTESAYTLVKRELDRLDAEIRKTKNEMSVSDSLLASEKAREKDAAAGFAELGIAPSDDLDGMKKIVDDRLMSLRTEFAEATSLRDRVSATQASLNLMRQQLEQAKGELKAKQDEKAKAEPLAAKIEVLKHVRDWFHSSNGPRTMSLAAIAEMTGYVNEYLRELNSEITVMPDNQGLSFAYEYVDGRVVSDPPPSTAKLSGGQKIELALAFRLAIYRYFGQKMGIMVLDEPTAHLSPDGIKHFGKLLQKVSVLAKNMNLQIVMPTHEAEIMPFMDSEIHFE